MLNILCCAYTDPPIPYGCVYILDTFHSSSMTHAWHVKETCEILMGGRTIRKLIRGILKESRALLDHIRRKQASLTIVVWRLSWVPHDKTHDKSIILLFGQQTEPPRSLSRPRNSYGNRRKIEKLKLPSTVIIIKISHRGILD